MNNKKLRFSKMHYNLGNQVSHKKNLDVGVGTIIRIMGEIEEGKGLEIIKDIQYTVVWKDGELNLEWHNDLNLIELESMVQIDEKDNEADL